jgi:hypothetical protein
MVLTCMIFTLLIAPWARAESDVRPAGRFFPDHSLLVGARMNPLGLRANASLGARMTLYSADAAVLRHNYFSVGGRAVVSPAFARAGVGVVLQPLSVLRLTGIYESGYFYGTFHDLQSYTDGAADFSDTEREERDKSSDPASHSYAAAGHHVRLGALAQMKMGPIAGRSHSEIHLRDYPLRSGDRYMYDSDADTLVKDGGWLLTNDADLLLLPHARWAVGVRHHFSQPLYESGEQNIVHRLGPLASYSFWPEREYSSLRVLVLINWHLRHRFRTGQDVPTAIPWAACGLLWETW